MWWFSENSKKLGHGDNREVKIGMTHKIMGEPVLCKYGLHASTRIIDALEYAYGEIIWKVKLGGNIVHDTDKSVATERTYIAGGIDISETLRRFARLCALDVIHLWDAPPVVVEYLKTGDELKRAVTLAAADAAAEDAARTLPAPWSAWAVRAARAVRTAAWPAWSARAAAWSARTAAWSAQDALGFAAANKKQNQRLTRMVNKVLRGVK